MTAARTNENSQPSNSSCQTGSLPMAVVEEKLLNRLEGASFAARRSHGASSVRLPGRVSAQIRRLLAEIKLMIAGAGRCNELCARERATA